MCKSNFERGKLKLLRPVDERYPITSPFGLRIHPVTGKEKLHKGIDFAVPLGTLVRAMCDGVVFRSGWENENNFLKGYGLRVWQQADIQGVPFYIWYGHLSAAIFEEGEKIKEGDVIGQSGKTGNATGPCLHVSARKRDTGDYYDAEFYNKETV